MTAGWGTHTTVYGTTTDSHTGAVATTLTVSNWVSGDSKWLIVQRGQGTDSSNSYTPAAQPGHTYNMWVYYKGVWSGSSAGITAYYRDANNVWQYWTSGFLASPSDSWNLSNFTTPPLPAGATAVSFGMSLTGNGTLTTDDYAMTVNP
jgi:hypothetical protein